MENKKIGFKVTDKEISCRGYKFEIGKTYKHTGYIGLCEEGFHFCLNANDCFNYYAFDANNRVFEIEYGDETIHGDDKSVTREIRFIREIEWQEVLTLVNSGKNNTGRANSGNSNSGNSNSGYRNSGNWNSGNWNSGYRNSGNWNSGYRNSGDSNSGNSNSGDSNSGNSNSGDSNSGNSNSGDSNSGNWNSGYRNSGYRNSGNWNSGNRNSGDSNSGYRNSGAFCTENDPELFLFDKPTDISVREWESSEVCNLMYSIENCIWIPLNMMSEDEKKQNPNAETTDGYLKTISMKEAWSNFWGNLKDEKKRLFLELPNFDAEKFYQITGIKTN